MEIQLLPLDQLKPFAKNPNKHPDKQINSLKKSMREFGFTSPILLSQDNMVIAGHARLQAATELGLAEVPTIFIDLPYEKAVAYVIADNQLARLAETDTELMMELLEGVLQIPDFDIEAIGFDLDEVNGLLDVEPLEVREDFFDPDEEVETRCKDGDLWALGKHRLLCGSCLEESNVKRLLGAETVDMLLTDPPYGVDYSSKNEMLNSFDKGNHVQRPIQNDAIENYREFFGSFLKNIPFSDYNTLYIFMSGQELHNVRLAFDDVNIKWGDYLVWAKNNHVLGRKDYNSKHEFCVYGWKNHHKFYGDFSTTILEFDKPTKSDLHPTMKPIPLFSKLIQDGSLKGMNVYDPFCGSGTSIIACEQLDRNCFAMELDPHYCSVILKRFYDFTGIEPIREDGVLYTELV